jgi:ribosomal protein S9
LEEEEVEFHAQPVEGAAKSAIVRHRPPQESVARVFIAPGSGKFEVNGKPVKNISRTWLG